MHENLYINGKFLCQPFSGVQRFATEITSALARIYPDQIVVLGPHGSQFDGAHVKIIGRRGGQPWEQLELPAQTEGGVLINLGNMAPLRLRSQVVVIHDAGVYATPEAYSWKFRLWYKLAHQWFVRGGATVATVSEFARSELQRCLGAEPDGISVISEGADHMGKIAADERVLSRVPPGRFVLAVGNLAAHKNLSALSILAGKLAERGVNLVVTGSLSWHGFRQVKPQGLPQPACYVGRVSDGELKALYEHAVCLVFPSRYEGFGLPAIEAMACGCPVVASDIPSLRETCGEAALYFDPAWPSDIADAVTRVVDDAGLRTQLRSAALARVGAFTWERAAQKLVDVARLCAKRRAVRAIPC
jgi:glycosyltransferase involved in cell wall biosynthesis